MLEFWDAGQRRTGRVMRAVGLHLMVDTVSTDKQGLAQKMVRMVTAAEAVDAAAFWRLWRQMGGAELCDEHGNDMSF